MAVTLKSFTTDTNANRGTLNTISKGTSPFQEGTVFTVSGHSFQVAEYSDGTKSENSFPVLTTSIGNLFLSTLSKVRVDTAGNPHQSKGTFVQTVREAIQQGGNDAEILDRIVNIANGRNVRVSREYFALQTSYGVGTTSILNFNFVE